MNWIDIVIVAIIAFYAWRGYITGLITILVDLLGFVISFFIAIKYYSIGAHFVANYINVPSALDNPLGLVLVWLLVEVVYYLISPLIVGFLPSKIKNSYLNKWGGAIFSGIKAVIIVSFIVLLLTLMPVSDKLKIDLKNSQIASYLIKEVFNVENKLGTNLLNEKDILSSPLPSISWDVINKGVSNVSLP